MKFPSPSDEGDHRKSVVRLVAVLTIVLLRLAYAAAQTDSSEIQDTMKTPEIERMLEGSVQQENSPLLDYIGAQDERPAVRVESRSRVVMSLQQAEGYKTGAYPGSPVKSTERIRLTDANHYTAGFIMEKDAGEQRIADYTAGYVALTQFGILNTAVVGDFYVESGQGVSLWRGADLGKGADVMLPARRAAGGVKPYLSASENSFLRGAAAEATVGPVTALAFYSRTPRSASIDTAGRATSFYTEGYFRTESELERRHTLSEILGGLRLAGRVRTLALGATWFSDSFTRPLLLEGGRRFSGDRYSVLSCDYAVSFNDFSVFGEWAGSGGAVAGSSGIHLKPDERVEIVAAIRYYPLAFVALHGFGFGERGENERGVYLGVRAKVADHARLGMYFDRFSDVNAEAGKFPGSGSELLGEIVATPVPRLECTLRYQRKTSNTSGSPELKQLFRLLLSYKFSKAVTVRGRLDRTFFSSDPLGGTQTGAGAYEEIIYTASRGLSINARLSWFSTDSYDCAIYAYERDLPGVMTTPALNGKGVRWYFLVKYTISEGIDIAAKYSDLLRDDLSRLGSGLDELPSNHDNRIGVQLDLRL